MYVHKGYLAKITNAELHQVRMCYNWSYSPFNVNFLITCWAQISVLLKHRQHTHNQNCCKLFTLYILPSSHIYMLLISQFYRIYFLNHTHTAMLWKTILSQHYQPSREFPKLNSNTKENQKQQQNIITTEQPLTSCVKKNSI